MTSKIRVAVVDDHPLLREGVVSVLTSSPDIEVIAQGSSADEAVQIAQLGKPDVILLDISIPGGGLDAIKAIAVSAPGARVMMLTVSVDKADVLEALRLGARAYVVKGVSGRDLLRALQAVVNGERYLSPSLGAMLLTNVDSGVAGVKPGIGKVLSSRETAVLSLVTQGLSNKQIGARLHLSDKTIKHYMTIVFQKLHVRSRLEAALLMKNMSSQQSQTHGQQFEGAQSGLSGSIQRAVDESPKTLV